MSWWGGNTEGLFSASSCLLPYTRPVFLAAVTLISLLIVFPFRVKLWCWCHRVAEPAGRSKPGSASAGTRTGRVRPRSLARRREWFKLWPSPPRATVSAGLLTVFHFTSPRWRFFFYLASFTAGLGCLIDVGFPKSVYLTSSQPGQQLLIIISYHCAVFFLLTYWLIDF